jgi:hypothetical protein
MIGLSTSDASSRAATPSSRATTASSAADMMGVCSIQRASAECEDCHETSWPTTSNCRSQRGAISLVVKMEFARGIGPLSVASFLLEGVLALSFGRLITAQALDAAALCGAWYALVHFTFTDTCDERLRMLKKVPRLQTSVLFLSVSMNEAVMMHSA